MHQQGLNGLTDLKISIHTNTAIKLQFYKSCRGNFHYGSIMSTDLGLSTGGSGQFIYETRGHDNSGRLVGCFRLAKLHMNVRLLLISYTLVRRSYIFERPCSVTKVGQEILELQFVQLKLWHCSLQTRGFKVEVELKSEDLLFYREHLEVLLCLSSTFLLPKNSCPLRGMKMWTRNCCIVWTFDELNPCSICQTHSFSDSYNYDIPISQSISVLQCQSNPQV